ncbi:unnamed protein product [marine sediment metagenome]|uniref:Uncharacterized protein n=1 Tax=marine sediment metagenome TaxID=412755 RepID=X1D934_9ZZZZ
MVDLAGQFVERRIKKTYTAIINGIPSEPVETSISTEDALNLNININKDEDSKWAIM